MADDPDFWERQMNGVPSYRVLQDYSWGRLEALPEDWGKPAPAPTASSGSPEG